MPELRLTPTGLALAKARQAMTRKDLAAAVLAFERVAKAGASVKLTARNHALALSPWIAAISHPLDERRLLG